ncbi:MAG: RluA family pseudouridine synthase [Lachnospiraceae bacterium]|nr:RluA family pseudouridine synthase [Lachnospiraceae bacterium]
MQTLDIGRSDAKQRLDKYLFRIFPGAPKSFIYRMLRKKNIVLNGKKADPSALLQESDRITCYFSDETYLHFRESGSGAAGKTPAKADSGTGEAVRFYLAHKQDVCILYEDADMIALDKPAGMFSQPQGSDLSAAEWLIGRELSEGLIKEEELAYFRPAPCHRLDRNTSGILLCAKTVRAAGLLSAMFRDRTGEKEYSLIVQGFPPETGVIEGILEKDEVSGKMILLPGPASRPGYSRTEYTRVMSGQGVSMVKALLITGRTHQLRVHMADAGYPIIGDPLYGDADVNRFWREKGVRRQLLHCSRIRLSAEATGYMGPPGGEIISPLPDIFTRCISFAGGK